MKTYDLSIGSNGIVKVWSDGFLKHICGLSFVPYDENKYTKFQIGDATYRVNANDYNSHRDVYNRFLNKCRRLKKGE